MAFNLHSISVLPFSYCLFFFLSFFLSVTFFYSFYFCPSFSFLSFFPIVFPSFLLLYCPISVFFFPFIFLSMSFMLSLFIFVFLLYSFIYTFSFFLSTFQSLSCVIWLKPYKKSRVSFMDLKSLLYINPTLSHCVCFSHPVLHDPHFILHVIHSRVFRLILLQGSGQLHHLHLQSSAPSTDPCCGP